MGATEGHACVFGVLDESYTRKLDSLVWSPAQDSSLLTSGQTQVSFGLSGALSQKCKQMKDDN